MNIPQSFCIGSQKVKVVYDQSLVQNEEANGKTDYMNNLVKLMPNTKAWPIAPARIEQIFWHEVVHWIFYSIGEEELRTNEALVDLISDRLTQVINTFEGKLT